VFVIGILLSVKKAGIFSVGGNIALQARGAIGNALVPIANHMSRSFGSGGVEAALAEFVRLQRMWVRLTTGWFCGVAGVSYFAIVAWLGPQFKLGAIAAVVLLFGYMVNLYTGMLTIYLNAIGRPGIETRYGLVSMGVNLVLTCGLAVFGVLGIAAATAIGTATGSIFLVRIAHRRVSQQIPSFTRLIPIVPGGIAFAISFCVSGVVGRVVPQGVVGLAAVGACALAGLFAYSLAVVGPKDVAQGIRSPRHLPRTLASAFMGADQDAGTVTDAGGS
jgi:O-antigen/teichoic acid export membrane protein